MKEALWLVFVFVSVSFGTHRALDWLYGWRKRASRRFRVVERRINDRSCYYWVEQRALGLWRGVDHYSTIAEAVAAKVRFENGGLPPEERVVG